MNCTRHKIFIPICLLLGVLSIQVIVAQDKRTQKINSYENFKSQSLSRSAPDILLEANGLKLRNPGEALNKVQDALGLSLARKDELTEAKCYILLGEINENISEWKLALENYQKAYSKLGELDKPQLEYMRTLQGLGNSNLMLENYGDALTYLNEALEAGQSTRSGKLADDYYSERLLDVSEVYYRMAQYPEALKALEELNPRNSRSSLATRFDNQKAKIYAQLNQTEKSKDIYLNSINTLRSSGKVDDQETQSLQNTKDEIAGVLRGQSRYNDEIELRNKSIEFNLESNNMSEVTRDKVEIGKTLEASGDSKSAIKELEEAVTIANTLDNPKEQANAYLALAQLYDKSGKTRQALSAYKKYSQAIATGESIKQVQLAAKSELITKQKDIDELTSDVSIGQREDVIAQGTVLRQQLIIYGLLFIILLTGLASFFIYRNAKASKLANQLLALKSLRSQMNPHFIFNALNSVNHFIAKQDERTANRFLSEFSQLMRLVMENSQEDFITLQEEQEILSLYLKLEHYRFRDKFDYELIIDKSINMDAVEIPPMLLQPYIENAVWHGLRYRETKGKLLVQIKEENSKLMVQITDDGIGRKKSAELKTDNQKKHNSTGLKNIQQRVSILNTVYKANYQVTIEDLPEGSGTTVRISLPISPKLKAA
ncbi:hypothetical protein BH09BAC3_BH09BAC3_26110 [soil metagenome]